MASLDTDVTMIPVGEGSSSAGPSSSCSKKIKRFEIKKWNAVALWAWGTQYKSLTLIPFVSFHVLMRVWNSRANFNIVCFSWFDQASSAKLIKLVQRARSALLLGVYICSKP
ncbi:hypothetical protein HHK36_021876 [Tetracentron sinense]|uniref:Uncharacterized protein n=1 Tax=Tetracentron sinense TaxID=13715 RepID=A0A835D891_TETSI|nr:hypothetical protein HHK36_021876 [Tetracentron sinense]